MKGLKLFVRPLEESDRDDLSLFFASEGLPGRRTPASACGLLGKLLGEIVAVAELDITPETVRLTDLLVTGRLRRKRIGRAMMREIETLARKLERSSVTVEDAGDAAEFLRRVGFTIEGGRWVRAV